MQNLRFALRSLFRAPGFTASAVLVLALGVGGSTAVFSVLRGVVLRPLGLPHPEELTRIYERPAGTDVRWPFSGPDYLDVASESTAFASVAGIRADQQTLTDDLLHSRHLDDDLDYSAGLPPLNRSRLLIHPPGSWALRPEAASAVPNLCFAADYVRTFTDIASMEGACEAGRRASNAILDRVGSTASRAGVWPLQEPPQYERWKQLDRDLYRIRRPHVFEIAGIHRAFEAADLLRRFSAITGLAQLDDFLDQFRLTDIVGGLLGRFGIDR